MEQDKKKAAPTNHAAMVLALAFGSAFGVPRGYAVKHKSKPQETAHKLAQIDAANAKRARKAARNRRLLEAA